MDGFIVKLWLECIWRPLALICLEATHEPATTVMLAEALLATLVAVGVAEESRASLSAAGNWEDAVAEVAHVLGKIISLWGWVVKPAGRGITWIRPEGASAGGPTGTVGLNFEAVATPLLKLSMRLSSLQAQHLESAADQWLATCVIAERRRQRLRQSLKDKEVNINVIVEAATEAVLRRAFQGGAAVRPRRRHSFQGAAAAAARKRRAARRPASDDDSDNEAVAVPDASEHDDGAGPAAAAEPDASPVQAKRRNVRRLRQRTASDGGG
mmetsp:Transcript_116401/g.201263  ORF Transcript_116401/g.201263 Transcript_116401/m.201263 type:complete len:269 (+) Transcript_116401:3-809(+)